MEEHGHHHHHRLHNNAASDHMYTSELTDDHVQQQEPTQRERELALPLPLPLPLPLSPQLPSLEQSQLRYQHPFDFSFPTLNLDGSTDHLTAHQSQHCRTPPAALSTLGAKASMADRATTSESGSSPANEQWEFVENLSEISNDDGDTASISSSTDQASDDGLLTPDEAELDDEPKTKDSLVNKTPGQEQVDQLPIPSSSSSSFVDVSHRATQSLQSSLESSRLRQVQRENDLIDSYMSEDLDTPRQSTITAAGPSTRRPTVVKTVDIDDKTRRILFISERSVPREDVDLMCSRVARYIAHPKVRDTGSEHRVFRLPITPAGISPPSATVVYGAGDRVSATIEHCVGADRRSFGSHGLRILDVDGEHSSIFTIGGNGKIDLAKPDIAVIYVNEDADEETGWIWNACEAVRSIQVPVLAIYEPKSGAGSPVSRLRSRLAQEGQLAVDAGTFLNTGSATMISMIQTLLNPVKSSVKPTKQDDQLKSRGSRQLAANCVAFMVLFMALLLPLLSMVIQPAWNPAVALPARHEALTMALQQAMQSENVTSEFNVQHLLPKLPAACYTRSTLPNEHLPQECESSRFDTARPNHLVLSLPHQRRYPQPVWTSIYKADGRALDFNQTRLIDGVYLMTFDADQACGKVILNMITKNPDMNITADSNFGRCLYKRYETASTDVTKAVSKDVAVMRSRAKHIGDKLSTELGAGIWATKNVTSQVAHYMCRELQFISRELQVIGNTAASVFGKAAQASNYTSSTLTKDLMVMQKDLVKFTKDISGSVKTRMELAKSESKALIQSQLSLSRERMHDFKKACERRLEGQKARKEAAAQKFRTQERKSQPGGAQRRAMMERLEVAVEERATYENAPEDFERWSPAGQDGHVNWRPRR